jgi:putative ABC transport system permease protein
MKTRLSGNIAAPRFQTLLLTTLALIAVCLAIAGIYRVVSYMVVQRTGEIGLRVALGAGLAEVMMMVFSEGARMPLTDLVLGGLATVAGIPVLKSMLFGVKPIDPLTFGGMA